MSKVAIIGNPEDIDSFGAIGIERYRRDEDYAVIFVMENVAEEHSEIIEKYKDARVPAVIVLPSPNGNSGFGMRGIKDSVIRALGADILGE